jgi:hypothetical protein
MSETMHIVLVTVLKPLEATPRGLVAFHGDGDAIPGSEAVVWKAG